MRWSPRAAALGAVIGSDPTGNTVYEVFETDASRKVSLAARWPWFDSMQFIETWDAASGRLLGTANVDAFAQDWLLTARIDPLRHRAAFLAFDPNFAPVLLPFDLASSSFGAPVAAPADSFYNLLTLDPGTGKAFITTGAVTEFCIFASGPLTSVDLDTGATAQAAIDSCTTTMVADGKQVHIAHGPLLSNNVLLPVARLQEVNERSFRATPSTYTGPRSPAFVAVDGEHQVLVVAYVAKRRRLPEQQRHQPDRRLRPPQRPQAVLLERLQHRRHRPQRHPQPHLPPRLPARPEDPHRLGGRGRPAATPALLVLIRFARCLERSRRMHPAPADRSGQQSRGHDTSSFLCVRSRIRNTLARQTAWLKSPAVSGVFAG